jgi:hypothetical protein
LPPLTLQDRLARHEVPRWLQEIDDAGGYSLYRIVPDQSAIHGSRISPAAGASAAIARSPSTTGD